MDEIDPRDCDGPCVFKSQMESLGSRTAFLYSLYRPLLKVDGTWIVSSKSDKWVSDGGVLWERRSHLFPLDNGHQCLVCPFHSERVLAQAALNTLRDFPEWLAT